MRHVESLYDLNHLPDHTRVRDAAGECYERVGAEWKCLSESGVDLYSSTAILRPAQILTEEEQ